MEQPSGPTAITDTRGLIQKGARATMPEWAMTRWFGATLWQWAALAAGIILGLPLIRRVSQRLLRGLILLAVGRHGYRPSEDTMRPTTVAGSVIITAYALYLGVNALTMPPAVTGFVTYTAILIGIYGLLGTMWFGLEALGRAYVSRQDMGVGGKTDEILINFVVRAAKIFLILVGLTFIGSAMGYNITAMLAGLGLGGVAIALAAKNTVENLLGTITILTDRPFRLGDRIKLGAVEGTITKVGLRSTRILTATESSVTLPNHMFINSMIENFGPLPRRVWRTTLALDPANAPDQVIRFLDDVRALIKNRSTVAPESVVVRANDFGPRSMAVLISVRIKALDETADLTTREEMVLGINHLIASHNIKIAPPGT
jgi:MscS family membrane protein